MTSGVPCFKPERRSCHAFTAFRSKLPVVGSAPGKPRASRSGKQAANRASVSPRNLATVIGGTSLGSTLKRGWPTYLVLPQTATPARRTRSVAAPLTAASIAAPTRRLDAAVPVTFFAPASQ